MLADRAFRELQGKRVGLITNPSGVNRAGVSAIELLRGAPGVQLVALFGPEHGVYGTVRAGDAVGGSRDERTGLVVHSLYGATRRPTAAMLQGMDALVYDLQDLGTRSYTFISTMGLAMEACGEAGVEFVVLDRPNPLGGVRVEGPMVEQPFRSFVSQWNVPYVYGLTCGELARMIQQERWIAHACRLTVIPMTGWTRRMTWQDTGLRWVPTSPNVRTLEAVFGYPALGLLGELGGGSGLTLGGALNRPFQLLAASWLDASEFSRQMKRRRLHGVDFPVFSVSRAGKTYTGVELLISDPANAPLVAVNFHALDVIRRLTGRNLVKEGVEAGRSFGLFDRATGSDRWRNALAAGRPAADLVREWRDAEEGYRRARRPHLLYGESSATGTHPASTPSSEHRGANVRVVTVSRGDTAYQLARDLGVTISALAEANPGVNMERLRPGQKLRVPK